MKILSITYNPYNNNNNSKTILSFFDGINPKDMAVLYFEGFSEVDYDFCDSYYRITDQDILKSLLNLSFKTHNSHPKIKPPIIGRDKLMKTASEHKSLLRIIRELLWSLGTWNTKELNLWIDKQKPDIIFSLLGNNLFVHHILLKIAKKHNLPFVAYYTDDYVLNCTDKSLLGRLHWWLTKRVYKKSMKAASKCYAIGEKMSKEYGKIYSRQFSLLGNCIDFEKFSEFNSIHIDLEKPVIISYIGNLGYSRWKTICDLGKLCTELNREKGWNIIINVYALEVEDSIIQKFSCSGVHYKGNLSPQGVIETMRKSEVLLHVESFEQSCRDAVHYSVSTKISEYLASRRLIIAYGPHEVASIELFIENKFGCVLTDLDTRNNKREKLIMALNNYNNNKFQAEYNYCRKYYDRKTTRQRLLGDMQSIVNNGYFE